MVTAEQIREWLAEVTDPEIPVLTLEDLGVLRNIQEVNGTWVITITPTYSGCPAMKTMEEDISVTLKKHGLDNFKIETILKPSWTTDWMSEAGKKKLFEYGIAPPVKPTANKKVLMGISETIICPRCKSSNTRMLSQFGSTACKALYVCDDCKEPFDYFKCL
ncbi:MAG: phenylacetate-CoA oxygenase subunit PaaJ [Flavobacteriales bacterium]|nr:phenylacetate-CoA oxygenase subunit PaaJ [Flavobacteriales bacterium]